MRWGAWKQTATNDNLTYLARIPKVMLRRCSLVVSWYSLDARRLDFDAATYLTDGSNRGFSPGHRSERYQLLLKCHLIHSGKQNQRNPQSPRWLEKEAGKRLLRIITPSTTINVDNQINKAKERKSWWNKQVCMWKCAQICDRQCGWAALAW